jgi:prophage antirepressor-like protein
MPDLIPFSFESHDIRVIPDDRGEPWFVAKDVAEALGYKWKGPSDNLGHVPNEWQGVQSVRTPGGTQRMAVLTEQGLYFFVARSDKPKALPFQKWIAGDVVPQIRKTGSYSAKPQPAPIPRIEVMEREVALCERSYNLAERCDDPVLRVMLIDRAKNALSSTNPALPSPQAGYFQTHQVLEDLGYSEKEIRKLAANAGKRLAAAYRTITGMEPEKVERIIDGATRKVSAFPASFRDDAQAVLSQWLSADAA